MHSHQSPQPSPDPDPFRLPVLDPVCGLLLTIEGSPPSEEEERCLLRVQELCGTGREETEEEGKRAPGREG